MVPHSRNPTAVTTQKSGGTTGRRKQEAALTRRSAQGEIEVIDGGEG